MINKTQIKGCQILANHQEEAIDVVFKIDDELFEQSIEVLQNHINDIYVPLPVCGGDIDLEIGFGWASYDDFSVAVYKKGCVDYLWEARSTVKEMVDSNLLVLCFPLIPEETEEWMDPDHPHHNMPRPSIWIDAASAFKQVFAIAK